MPTLWGTCLHVLGPPDSGRQVGTHHTRHSRKPARQNGPPRSALLWGCPSCPSLGRGTVASPFHGRSLPSEPPARAARLWYHVHGNLLPLPPTCPRSPDAARVAPVDRKPVKGKDPAPGLPTGSPAQPKGSMSLLDAPLVGWRPLTALTPGHAQRTLLK